MQALRNPSALVLFYSTLCTGAIGPLQYLPLLDPVFGTWMLLHSKSTITNCYHGGERKGIRAAKGNDRDAGYLACISDKGNDSYRTFLLTAQPL